jgi:hypothetical protein
MKKIALFVLSVALAACGEAPSDLLVFDVERAIDTKRNIDLLDIANDCEFIPLDNSNQKEGLIGDILEITESKNRFYVIDRTENPVKLFDRNGKFIATRGRVGRGPDEFLFVDGITVDWEKENLYLMADNGGTASHSLMRAYRADGEIFGRNDSITRGKIAFFDDKVLLFTDNFSTKPMEIGEMFTFMETFSPDLHRETALEVPFKGPNRIMLITNDADGQIAAISVMNIAPVIASNNGASLLVKEGRSDTVYHYTGGAMEPFLRLDFGSYAIPDEAFEPSYDKPSSTNMYGVKNIYEGDRYILVTGSYQPPHLLLFDRREDYAGFTTLGPNGSEGLFLDGIRFNPAYIRDNQLVGYISALDIVDNAESITNPDLKALAATLKEDSNPVIVTATLKK